MFDAIVRFPAAHYASMPTYWSWASRESFLPACSWGWFDGCGGGEHVLVRVHTGTVPGAAPLMIVLFLLIPVPRLNTQSQMTLGVVLFLALLRTLRLLTRPRRVRTPLRIAMLAGMVAAGVSTLRMTFVPSAVLCIALAFFVRLLLQRAEWKRHIVSFFTITAAFIFTLLPWSIVLYFSSRSLFYPLMKGTERPEFTIVSAGLTPSEKVHFLASFILQPALLVLIAPGLLLLSRRYWKTELPLYLAGLITMAVIVLSFTRANFLSLFRYSFPPLFAVSCAPFCLPEMLPLLWLPTLSLRQLYSRCSRPRLMSPAQSTGSCTIVGLLSPIVTPTSCA